MYCSFEVWITLSYHVDLLTSRRSRQANSHDNCLLELQSQPAIFLLEAVRAQVALICVYLGRTFQAHGFLYPLSWEVCIGFCQPGRICNSIPCPEERHCGWHYTLKQEGRVGRERGGGWGWQGLTWNTWLRPETQSGEEVTKKQLSGNQGSIE